MALIDFTLSNARRFYSSMGNPSGLKGLTLNILQVRYTINRKIPTLSYNYSTNFTTITAKNLTTVFLRSDTRITKFWYSEKRTLQIEGKFMHEHCENQVKL